MAWHISWQKISKSCKPIQLQKCLRQCLLFQNPLKPKYFEFGSKILQDQSPLCWITIILYPSLCGGSKPMNRTQKNQYAAQEHYSLHLNLSLVGIVHGVGLWANRITIFVYDPYNVKAYWSKFQLIRDHQVCQKNHPIKLFD